MMPVPLGGLRQLLQIPNLVQCRKPRTVANLAKRVLIHVIWKFSSTRQSIRFEVFVDRPRESEIANVPRSQEKADRKEFLGIELATTCRIPLPLTVNQPGVPRIRSPERLHFNSFDRSAFLHLKIAIRVGANAFG